MPQQTGWYIEGRVIRVRYTGDVTLADVEQSGQEEKPLLDAGTGPLVHVLLDYTGCNSRPTSLPQMQGALEQVLHHPRKGWTIAYGRADDKLGDYVNSTLSQTANARYRSFGTLNEALAFLAHVDVTLAEQLEER